MLKPAYVECDDFRLLADYVAHGLRWRIYRLKANPDQRPPERLPLLEARVLRLRHRADNPDDGVFHVGSFMRVTA